MADQNKKMRFFHTEDLDSDQDLWREVFPTGNKKYEWKKDKQELFYRQSQKGGYTFINDPSEGITDFDFFYNIDLDTELRCIERFIVSEKKCGDNWIRVHVGKFTMNNGKFDVDKCTINVKQDIVDDYSCLKDNKKEKFNILSSGPSVSVFSPIQNNFEFSSTRNKEFLGTANKPSDATGGWKKFYTKAAANVPDPHALIYSNNLKDDYYNALQTKDHAIWISYEAVGSPQRLLEVFRFSDNSITQINISDANSTAKIDRGAVVFTNDNLRTLRCHKIDSGITQTVVINHGFDIVWFDVDNGTEEGHVVFLDSNGTIYHYNLETDITRIVTSNESVTLSSSLQGTVLNISFADDYFSFHSDNDKKIYVYRPSLLTYRSIANFLPNVQYLHSENTYLTFYDADGNIMYVNDRDDTTFKNKAIRLNGGSCRWQSRENEWLVMDDSSGAGPQIAINLITRKEFFLFDTLIGSPSGVHCEIENGWFSFMVNGQPDIKISYLDSIVTTTPNSEYQLTISHSITYDPNFKIAKGIERIYYTKDIGGGNYQLVSKDIDSGTEVVIEALGSTVLNGLLMNNYEQVLSLNQNRARIDKENIQRNDELTVWFREKIVTICEGGLNTAPQGGGWLLFRSNCNQFGTSIWVKQPSIAAPSPTEISEGGCNCIDEVSDLSNDLDECYSVDPNGTISSYLIPNITSNFNAGLIVGVSEMKINNFTNVTSNFNIDKPRNGSTYNWALNGNTSFITSGQGTPNITLTLEPVDPSGTFSLTCQETNPCDPSIPIATHSLTIRSWNQFLTGIPPINSVSSGIINSPSEVCPNGIQTFSIASYDPACLSTWTVDSPALIVGTNVGETVDIDLNGSSNPIQINIQKVCPVAPLNYQLISPCNELHSDSWWWVIGNDIEYDNQRLLKNVVEDLVANICPDILGVISNFFQWNPTEPSLINYVYGGINEYNFLTIGQKSDIRNPNASNNATVGNITWDQFKEWMANIEVYPIIKDNYLHLEHISVLKGGNGLDLTQDAFIEYSKNQNRYSYAKSEMDRSETYTFMEAQSADFVGFPIDYKNYDRTFSLCVSENVKDHPFEQLTVDLKYIQTNSGDIDNNGFVILANTFDGVNYNVIQKVGLLSGTNILNSPMSISILQDRFMRYNRVLLFGEMNRRYTTFESAAFFKKQEKFKIPLCCNDSFDPIDLITTNLGSGEVDTAEIDYETDMLEIKLKYE